MKKQYLPEITYKARKLRKKLTPEEKILWSVLRKLPYNFRRQHFIDGFYADFYSSQAALVIELDGAHHSKKENQEYDAARTAHLESLGYTVIRFWNSEVRKNLTQVIKKIISYC